MFLFIYELIYSLYQSLSHSYVHSVWQIIDANKGGVVAEVEGLKGFVPFSQISTVSSLPTLTFL